MGVKKGRILIYILAGIVIFTAGILFAPLIRERGYQIKKWISKPFISPPGMRVVKLYFSSPDEKYLSPQEREIVASSQITEEIKEVMEELIKGPEGASLSPTLPQDTKVRAVFVKDENIYVDLDFSSGKKHPGGSTGELLTIYSIVNTLLVDFPSQSRVQILIQGKPEETLAGHIDIREPLDKRMDLIKEASES
ncbi:MAG: GerMN domain-containing protein [Candidatus Aerophobetes bacterium]|nr:GerMN domain-containing protein [Candidatus Aerophobetes bacterium]